MKDHPVLLLWIGASVAALAIGLVAFSAAKAAVADCHGAQVRFSAWVAESPQRAEETPAWLVPHCQQEYGHLQATGLTWVYGLVASTVGIATLTVLRQRRKAIAPSMS